MAVATVHNLLEIFPKQHAVPQSQSHNLFCSYDIFSLSYAVYLFVFLLYTHPIGIF